MIGYTKKVLWSFDKLYPNVKYFVIMGVVTISIGGLLTIYELIPGIRQVMLMFVYLMFVAAVMERLYISVRVWHNLAELPRDDESFRMLLRDKQFNGDEYVVYLLNTVIVYSNFLDKLLCAAGYLPLLLFNVMHCFANSDISTFGTVFWKYELDIPNQIFDKAYNTGKMRYRYKTDYITLTKYVRENGLNMNSENYREFLTKMFG